MATNSKLGNKFRGHCGNFYLDLKRRKKFKRVIQQEQNGSQND